MLCGFQTSSLYFHIMHDRHSQQVNTPHGPGMLSSMYATTITKVRTVVPIDCARCHTTPFITLLLVYSTLSSGLKCGCNKIWIHGPDRLSIFCIFTLFLIMWYCCQCEEFTVTSFSRASFKCANYIYIYILYIQYIVYICVTIWCKNDEIQLRDPVGLSILYVRCPVPMYMMSISSTEHSI